VEDTRSRLIFKEGRYLKRQSLEKGKVFSLEKLQSRFLFPNLLLRNFALFEHKPVSTLFDYMGRLEQVPNLENGVKAG